MRTVGVDQLPVEHFAAAEARHAWFQVQWFGAVTRWSYAVTVGYATAVDRSRIAERRVSAPHRAGPANADGSVWDRLAACESGGDWGAATGNGYYGGLQFTLGTYHAYGGVGMPNQASREQQIAVAERVLAGQGPGAWPVCSYRAGLR